MSPVAQIVGNKKEVGEQWNEQELLRPLPKIFCSRASFPSVPRRFHQWYSETVRFRLLQTMSLKDRLKLDVFHRLKKRLVVDDSYIYI